MGSGEKRTSGAVCHQDPRWVVWGWVCGLNAWSRFGRGVGGSSVPWGGDEEERIGGEVEVRSVLSVVGGPESHLKSIAVLSLALPAPIPGLR